MTLESLDFDLPNGLHDAHIKRLSFDFEAASASMTIEVFIPTPDSQDHVEPYSEIGLDFSGVSLFTVGPPAEDSAFLTPGDVRFQFDSDKPSYIPENLDKLLPADSIKYSLYILDWDCYLHIAAQKMQITKAG